MYTIKKWKYQWNLCQERKYNKFQIVLRNPNYEDDKDFFTEVILSISDSPEYYEITSNRIFTNKKKCMYKMKIEGDNNSKRIIDDLKEVLFKEDNKVFKPRMPF